MGVSVGHGSRRFPRSSGKIGRMNGLALNLILALVWALFLGEVSLRSLSLGFLIGFAVLWLFRRGLGSAPYIRTVLGALGLAAFFFWALSVANVQMARLALHAQPTPALNPMIVSVPLRLRGEGALTLLAAMTGLMPGTVTLGFSPERDTMYVHAAGMESAAAARHSVQDIEARILRVIGQRQRLRSH